LSTPLEAALPESFESLKAKGLYRSLAPVDSPNGSFIQVGREKLLNFSSNNYLGLAFHPKVVDAAARAVKRWGAGSGASRLLSGNLSLHESLEKKLASFKKEEAALTFSSGYMANLGIISSLVGPADVVLIDRLNHASLIDAVYLSGAKLWVYPHRDLQKLSDLLSRAMNFKRKLVVTDSYFGMDGDLAPLDKLVPLCKEHDAWLMVDEAHATGVFGKEGRPRPLLPV
jgi:7-keto-8-aminopelargonate synthetase-like enzyme